MHANSAADVPARLEALASSAGLPLDAVHSQVSAALDAVVHVGRARGGRRLVREIGLFDREERGRAVVRAAVRFTDEGDTVALPGSAALYERIGLR